MNKLNKPIKSFKLRLSAEPFTGSLFEPHKSDEEI